MPCSESKELDDEGNGKGVMEGVGDGCFCQDGGQLLLEHVFKVKPLKMGSCCVRAVVWVKRGGSSVTVYVIESQKGGSWTVVVQASGPPLISQSARFTCHKGQVWQ